MNSVKNKYEDMQDLLTKGFEVPEISPEEEGYSEKDYYVKRTKTYVKEKYKVYLIGILYALCGIHALYQLFQLGWALYHVDTEYLMWHPLHIVGALVIPYIIWIISTLYNEWNFHNRKIGGMIFCVLNTGIIISHVFYRIFCGLLLPILVKFPTNPDISLKMVFNLSRLILIILTLVPGIGLTVKLLENIKSEMTKRALVKFKLGKKLDMRKNKKFSYDMQVVTNLKTGEQYTIKEKDRSLHSLANGTTGTGKTSSLFTCAIAHDMDQVNFNKKYQKMTIKKWLKNGTVRMKEPMKDEDFDIDNFEVIKGERDIIEKLKFKAPVAGMSAMAPNASFSDEIYALAKQKGIKVNRLDPTLDSNGRLKEGFKGFNPLYINPDLSELEWMMEVTRKATLFADVTQAVYDASGSSDVYFASLNKNITTCVTMLILLTYPDLNNGEQPTPLAVQEVLNDFKKAAPYRKHLVEKYGKTNEAGNIVKEAGKTDVGQWQSVIDFVDSELLGPGAEKMFDQTRGIRVIINTFMNNPLIRNALCAKDSIDLDKALAKGEITVVNYALELGSDSIAFGMFFLLSFIQAVFRRPGKESTRLPHFFYIDEFPVLLHKSAESCFSLFRQYRVAMFVAIQSLSQMTKSRDTAFLKDLLLGNCAHHFVFGRVAPEEMKLYTELAGTDFKITEMKGVNETALTVDNPNISYSRREQMTRENIIEGSDIRSQDFQEVLVVTVDQGSPVTAFQGKVSFLPSYDRIKVKKFTVDWDEYYDENGTVQESEEVSPMEENLDSFENNLIESVNKIADEEKAEKSPSFRDLGRTVAQDNFHEEINRPKNIMESLSATIKKEEKREREASECISIQSFMVEKAEDSFRELDPKSKNIFDDLQYKKDISKEEAESEKENEVIVAQGAKEESSELNNQSYSKKRKYKIPQDNVDDSGWISYD